MPIFMSKSAMLREDFVARNTAHESTLLCQMTKSRTQTSTKRIPKREKTARR
jgi:hypothetical protein